MHTLGTHDAIPMIAVKDIGVAKRFYQETLGLTPHGPGHETVVTLKSGNSFVNVYASQYAGTNKATTAMWVVGDALATVVDALKSKGIAFEHYDLPHAQHDGDVHVFGDLRVAWFKDPDGNILSIQNQ